LYTIDYKSYELHNVGYELNLQKLVKKSKNHYCYYDNRRDNGVGVFMKILKFIGVVEKD